LRFLALWDDLELDWLGGDVGSSVYGDYAFDLPDDVVYGGHECWAGACGDVNVELEVAGDAVYKLRGGVAGWFGLVKRAGFGELTHNVGFQRGVIN